MYKDLLKVLRSKITDPDVSMATSGRRQRLEPSYQQHGVVDDEQGVILDVEVTTGELNEGQAIHERLDRLQRRRESSARL